MPRQECLPLRRLRRRSHSRIINQRVEQAPVVEWPSELCSFPMAVIDSLSFGSDWHGCSPRATGARLTEENACLISGFLSPSCFPSA
jgi:hypothetical protein